MKRTFTMKRSFSRSLMALVGAAMILPAMALTSCIADDGEALTWPPADSYLEPDQKPVPELPVGMRDKGQWTSLGAKTTWPDHPEFDVFRLYDNNTEYGAYWHTATNSSWPYWAAVKMEDVFEIGGFIIWNRATRKPDGADNGVNFPRDIVLYVSTDADKDKAEDVAWTEVLRGILPPSPTGALDDRPPFAILLPNPVQARCFKIEILNSYGNPDANLDAGGSWTYINEMDIIQPEFYNRDDYPGIKDVYF